MATESFYRTRRGDHSELVMARPGPHSRVDGSSLGGRPKLLTASWDQATRLVGGLRRASALSNA